MHFISAPEANTYRNEEIRAVLVSKNNVDRTKAKAMRQTDHSMKNTCAGVKEESEAGT